MRLINQNQRGVAFVLLVSVFLQSCVSEGVPVGQVSPVTEGREGGSPSSQAQSLGPPPEITLPDSSRPPSAQSLLLQANNSSAGATNVVASVHQGVPGSLPDLSERDLKRYVYESRITSTKELVAAFNASPANSKEEQALYQWLENYMDWLNRKPIKLSDHHSLQEYVGLGQIKLNRDTSGKKKELLRSHFVSLIEKIRQVQTSDEECLLIQALDTVLEQIDRKLFGKTEDLIRAANYLLDKLNPTHTVLNRGNYAAHECIFNALHNILFLICKIDPSAWDSTHKEGLYRHFQQQLNSIQGSAYHYPIVYHSLLLKQSLRRLQLEGDHVKASENLERAWQALKGLSYTWNAAMKLIPSDGKIEIPLEDCEKAYQSFEAASKPRHIPKKSWYDYLMQLMHWMSLSIRDSVHHESFFKYLKDTVQALSVDGGKQEDLRAFLYGAITQLTRLAVEGTQEVRQRSLRELESLSGSWCRDQEVMEGIFEDLLSIRKRGYDTESQRIEGILREWEPQREQPNQATSNHPEVRSWFHKPCTCTRPEVKVNSDDDESVEVIRGRALQTWLDAQTLQDKLGASTVTAAQATQSVNNNVFFKEVRKQIIDTLPSVQVMKDALKKRYKHRGVTQMAAFAALGSIEGNMTVKEMECYLKLNEQIKIKVKDEKDKEAQDPSQPQDQVDAHNERLEWVKTPINPEELFQDRKLQPDGPVQEISKVLLVGEAGTGKTSLTKKLAHIWSTENWEKKLEAVYWLPVRNLPQGTGNGIDLLTKAILEQCFHDVREKDPAGWQLVIEWQLAKPSTLIILDGLDEQADGVTQAIIQAIKDYPCKLLLTSRPYGIENERSLVNIDVDYVGLDEGQRDRFVHRILRNDRQDIAKQLLQFVKEHGLGNMTQIPVNLQILCALWKDRIDESEDCKVSKPIIPVGLPALYRELVNYVWGRFEVEVGRRRDKIHQTQSKKPDPDPSTNRSGLFEDLEKIALKSLDQENRETTIRHQTVTSALVDHLPSPILENAGFLLLQKVNQKYEFPHLTFHEYFSGRRLARKLLGNKANDVLLFLGKYMYKPEYRRVLSFMAGEVSKGMFTELDLGTPEKGKMPIQELLRIVEQVPQDVLGFQHLLLQLRLLNEYLLATESSEERSAILSALENELHLEKNLIMWFNKSLRQYRQYGDRSARVLYTILMTLLSEASGVTRHYNSALLPLILNALKDSNSAVCIAALQALPTLVEKGADIQELLPPILNASKDSDADVRRAALQAL